MFEANRNPSLHREMPMTLTDLKVADRLEQPSIEDVLQEIATARFRPDAAIGVCLLRFDEAAPTLLDTLRWAAANGDEITDGDANLLLYGLHILGAHREKRAFEPLMLFLRRSQADVEWVLGHAVTEALNKIVVSVYDGKAEPLFENIANTAIDEFVRTALFEAAIFLTVEGRIERSRMEELLRRFHAQPLAPKGDFTWYGFVCAVAFLGLASLAPIARKAIEEEWVPPNILTTEHFAEDLRAAETAPDDIRRLAEHGLGYLDDVFDALRLFSPVDDGDDPWPPWGNASQPYINPLRHVGRNDPCPCGSGRKAKRCCLSA
jgi:hypothetical protein